MKHKIPLLTLGFSLTIVAGAQAQPDLKTPDPQFVGDPLILNERRLAATPMQQAKIDMQGRRLDSLREQLTQTGFTDTAIQDAIVNFYKDKDAAQDKLRKQWEAVMNTMRQPATTEAQLAIQLNDFQAAADQEKARRSNAFKELSAKVGLAQKTRLQVVLMALGVLDEDTGLFQEFNGGAMTLTPPLFEVLGGGIIGRFGNITNGNIVTARVQTPVGPVRLDYGIAQHKG